MGRIRSCGTILEALEVRAQENAASPAFVFDEKETLTYRETWDRSRELGRRLAALGVGEGDFCPIILPPSLTQVLLVFAVQQAGAAPVLLDPEAPPSLLLRRIRHCGANHSIVTSELKAAMAGQEAEDIAWTTPDAVESYDPPEKTPLPTVTPEHVAYLQFTSGTTGEPKAVVILQRQLMAYLDCHYRIEEFPEPDVFLCWVPMYHDMGLVGYVYLSLYLAGVCHLLPPNVTSLMNWFHVASRVGATVTSGPDFAYRLVTRSVNPQGLDLSRLRMTGSGGEALRIETIQRFEERFGLRHTSLGGYGQAESVMCISMGKVGRPLRVDEAGNVDNGHPLPGLEVRIVDEAGRRLGAGEPGEITMRGPTVFAGYLNDEEATSAAIRDGWLHTGDTGYLDDEGYLFVLGRKKLLIKRGGSAISPREVEVAADQIDGVRFSVAIGVPRASSIASEDLVVLAEAKPEMADTPEKRHAMMEAIAEAVHEATGHAPSDVVLLKPRTMPRTANGKVQHTRARELYGENALPILS